MGAVRPIRTGPSEAPAERRRNAGAAAAAAAFLIALLFAIPILLFRLQESRDRLNGLLRRETSLRAKAQARTADLQADLRRKVRDGARDQEEALERVEDYVEHERPRARAASEMRLPEPSPLPHGVTAATQAHGATPGPMAAVAAAKSEGAVVDAALDDDAEQVVAQWLNELDAQLQLTTPQQEGCRRILEDYQRELLAWREQILRTRQGGTHVEFRARRDGIIKRIEGILTAEQLERYQELEKAEPPGAGVNVIAGPLPGVGIPRRQ